MSLKSKNLILNLDDQSERSDVNTQFLREEGFEVLEAANSEEAAQLLIDNNPFLVLTNDSQFLQNLKTNLPDGNFYTLLITEELLNAEVSADAFIKAPFSKEELFNQVKILIRLHKSESKALNQSTLIQNVVKKTPIIFYIYNTITRRNEFITPHTAFALGYTRKEFKEFSEDFVERFMHPGDLKKLSGHFSELARIPSGQSLEFEYRMRHKSGEWLWFQSRDCVLRRTPENLPEQILGVATDITLRKQSANRNLIQYEIGRILTSSESMEEAAPQILQTICRQLDFKIGEFWCFDKSEETLQFKTCWHSPSRKLEQFVAQSRQTEFVKGEGLPGKVWKSGAPVWIEDLTAENKMSPAALLNQANLQSGLAFPVLLGDSFFGVLSFFSSEIRKPDEALIRMFGATGNHIGQFIKRQKTEEKLRQSEERYRTFIQQSSEGIWRIEFDKETSLDLPASELIEFAVRHGFLAECNDAMAKMYGLEKAEDLTGNRISDLFDMNDPANYDYFRAFIESDFRLNDAESHEKDIHGNDKYFLNSMIGVVENSTLVRIWGTQRDITRQKAAEQNLIIAERRASEDYLKLLSRIVPLAQAFGASRDLLSVYRQILDFVRDSMPCAAFMVSFFDPAARQRIAAYVWGLEGEVDISTLPPMPITEDGGPNSQAVLTGKTQVVDGYMDMMMTRPHVILQENGIDPQSSLTVPMSIMGRVIGTLEVQAYEGGAFQQEHTVALEMVANLAATAIENVRLLESEASARRTAEIANHAKDEFIAIVSHELRSPLNAILGWARILQNKDVEVAQVEQALDTIIRNARAQSKLIEDLLDTARMSSGKLLLEMKPVKLEQIIKSVIDVSKPAADAKEISFYENLDPSLETFKGDPDRLQQIVSNLISNALKFTPKGGNISVWLKFDNSNALITVKDTGIGIKPEFLPRMFEQFTQSDTASTRRYGGLGIGLALARKLVELHGGTISAESEGEGKGATFIVALPLRSNQPFVDNVKSEMGKYEL